MNVLKVSIIDQPSDMLRLAVKKGYRTEAMYDNYVFQVDVELDHMWEYFSRLYWECNHFHVGYKFGDRKSSAYCWKNDGYMALKLRLSEAVDFIYACTPQYLKKEIPDNIRTIEDIRQLVSDFLIDDSLGRQEFYHSVFKSITMLDFSKTEGLDMSGVNLIRQHVPNGTIVHIMYQNKNFDGDLYGMYMFQSHNKKQLNDLAVMLQRYAEGFSVIDILKDKNGYYNIGIALPHTTQDRVDVNVTEEFKRIYDTSYSWTNNK